MSRRLGTLLLLLVVVLVATPAAPAGPALAGAASTPERIKEVAADLVCLCGSCNRESLATCLCGAFAVPERERIGRMLSEGRSHDQIVEAYVERFGPMVLARPPEGYDVVWIIPLVVLAGGVLGVRRVLVGWRRVDGRRDGARHGDEAQRGAPDGGSESPPPAESTGSSSYTERLQRDLDRFES